MKKYLIVYITILLTILFTISSAWASPCWVTSEVDSQNNNSSLRQIVEGVIATNNEERGCSINSNYADYHTIPELRNYIIFQTNETQPTGNAVKRILLDANYGPINIDVSVNTLIGNPSDEAITNTDNIIYDVDAGYTLEDDKVKDYGYVIIDAKELQGETILEQLPFNCAEDSALVVVRNTIFNVPSSIGHTEIFSQTCLIDGGDVHICSGELITDADENYIDPNSGQQWCQADSIETCTKNHYYKDKDGDGFGDPLNSIFVCEQDLPTRNRKNDLLITWPKSPYYPGRISVQINSPLYVLDSNDCDDANKKIHPEATEVCDNIDNNCNSLIDMDDEELDASTLNAYYNDLDSDGYGDLNNKTMACEQPINLVTDSTDCDDNLANRFPGNVEICGDDIDQDCDAIDKVCLVVDPDPSPDSDPISNPDDQMNDDQGQNQDNDPEVEPIEDEDDIRPEIDSSSTAGNSSNGGGCSLNVENNLNPRNTTPLFVSILLLLISILIISRIKRAEEKS